MAHHLRLVGDTVLVEDEPHPVPQPWSRPARVAVPPPAPCEVYDLFGAPGEEHDLDGYGPEAFARDTNDPPFAA